MSTVTTPQQLAQASTPTTVTIGSSGDFSAALLEALGLPVTAANVGALNAWQAAEGQWGASGSWNAAANHNPLNIEAGGQTQNAGGGNNISIWPDWTTGVANTAAYIQQRTPGIVKVLATGQASPALLSAAVTQSHWGTGNFANGSTASQSAPAGATQSATLDAYFPGTHIHIPGTGAGSSLAPSWLPGAGLINSAQGALSFLFSVRFFELIGGVLLIGLGTAVFLSSTKPGQEAISLAPALAAA